MSIFGGMAVVLLLFAVYLGWDYLPGTIRHDQNGFAHGTGWVKHYYESGPILEKSYYRNGIVKQSTWYRPDGTVVATTQFDVTKGGTGYYLWDDGSIKTKMHYCYSPKDRLFVADGEAVHYDRNGTIIRTSNYRNGTLIEDAKPKDSKSK